VERLGPQGNTNLAAGLLAAFEQVRAGVPDGMRVRVVVFTDGQANEGVATDAAGLSRLVREGMGAASLSAFGYGDDADQDLLRGLSDTGRGNYAYVATPEDALTAFAQELGGLLSTHAQRIEVRVAARDGAVLTAVVSDVEARGTGEVVTLRVPELLAEEVRHLVLGLRLAPRAVALDAPVAVADVELSYERLEGGRLVTDRAASKAAVRFVAPAEAQAAPAPDLDAIVAVAELIRAQIAAEEAAARGDYAVSHDVLRRFAVDAGARGHAAVAATAGRLAGALRDADAEGRSRAYRTSVRKGAARGASSKLDRAAEDDLRAMGRAAKTSAQERMERSFGAPAEGTRPVPGPTPPAGAGRLDRRRSRRW
jgi:Ca-activated chloride channel family protein